MSIKIGHASGDEKGGAHGGQAGDQTGRETRIQDWYASGWTCVLRPKSAAVAEQMASACETLCKNTAVGDLVGYDQWQRNTLWDELERVNWKPSLLTTKCETDCSAFMTACARCAGIDIPRVALGGGQYNAPVTWTMRKAFSSTGAFDVLTDSKYLTTDKYLKRGDVLVKEPQSGGHTCMALENGSVGNPATVSKPAVTTTKSATEVAHHFDKECAGLYKCTAYALFVRDGAGTNKKLMTTIVKGKEVRCYGYYNFVGSTRWLYVQFSQNGTLYTGYASEKYLEKVVSK